jgi:hypothetical protein
VVILDDDVFKDRVNVKINVFDELLLLICAVNFVSFSIPLYCRLAALTPKMAKKVKLLTLKSNILSPLIGHQVRTLGKTMARQSHTLSNRALLENVSTAASHSNR